MRDEVENKLEDHLWKLSSERRELYVLSADMVPRGSLLVFSSLLVSPPPLLSPSPPSTSVVPPLLNPSISTPRLNREKSFIVYPKVLWESSNQNLEKNCENRKLNPDLIDPGEYVMEKVVLRNGVVKVENNYEENFNVSFFRTRPGGRWWTGAAYRPI